MSKKKKKQQEKVECLIQEFAKAGGDDGDGDDEDKLSLIDIKAAIASQAIPISELFNKQDIAANRVVMSLIHDAEVKAKGSLQNEIIILEKKNLELRTFKDKSDVVTLVGTSKTLTDKPPRIVDYITARLQTGRGVDLSGDLTDTERQDKVNEAIDEELKLIETQGISFKTQEEKDEEHPFEDETEKKALDMTDEKNNPLIPASAAK